LSEEQARQAAEVTVLAVEKDDEPPVRPDASLVNSYCFPMSLPLRNPGISIDLARELKRSVREFDIVHIHAIWNFPTYYAMRSAYAAGIPYIIAPQGSFDPWALRQNVWGKRLYGQLTEVPLFKRAACFQAVTASEARQIEAFGLRVSTSVIPNGVDGRLLQREAPSLATKLGLSPGQKTLLYLSRLHPKKGVDILIQAFGQISVNESLTLVIAGGDAGSGYSAKLRQLASQHGLGTRCIFLGEVKGGEKYEVLLGADFFALPSHSEGLPVAVIEAMAAGLPVLITSGCNLPEVGEWKAGRILAPTANKFATALIEMLRSPNEARRMAVNGRRLVKAKFTWETIARETRALYERFCMRAA
jgi:poly(glycerol-phosphate) alpha-glucosyltransferase